MRLAPHTGQRRWPAITDLSPQAPAGPRAGLLGTVLGVALGLRLWGVNWGLPWAFHPDEVNYVDSAREMLRTGDPNPAYFMNPSLFTYLIASELLLCRALGPFAGPLAPDVPGSANMLARLDSALLGTASVAVLGAVGNILLGRWAGLLAALLLAVSFLHVRDSHYGVNDVPATALLLLSLYFDARLLRRPSFRWYVLAGLAGGLSTSTKYNMGFFFAPLLTAHWLAARSQRHPPWGRASLAALSLAGLASLAGYVLGTPYTLLDFEAFRADFLNQYHLGSDRWLGQPPVPVPWLYLTSLLQGFGALPLVLALAGLARAWHSRPIETILVGAFPVAYLAFLLPKALFFPRFALPLVPFCCLWAAHGATELAGQLRPAGRRGSTGEVRFTVALTALLAAALAQPLANDVLHNRLLLRTDTRVLANEWVQANLPRESRLKVTGYSLMDADNLTHTPNSGELTIEVFADDLGTARPLDELARSAQYIVTSSFVYGRDELDPVAFGQSRRFGYRLLQQRLEAQAQLIARFSPGRGGREVPFRLDDVLTPFWNLEEYERPGPTLRVYSLTPIAARP